MNMELVKGIDVSVWEPRVDWRAAYEDGVRFAFIRATSDVGYVDRKFKSHWEGAKQAGILRGAYHYLFAKKPAKDQASHFVNTVGDDKGELPPVVDLEDYRNDDATSAQLIKTCGDMLAEVGDKFNRKPILYSRTSFLEPRLTINRKPPSWAKDCLLWLAQYPWEFNPRFMPNNNMPQQPSAKEWQPWTFWQYSAKGVVPGVTDEIGLPTACDLDWFRGNEEQLYKFAGYKKPDSPPSPDPDPHLQPQPYVVKQGDTFKGIADEHGLTLLELLDANPALPTAGTNLTIPRSVPPPVPPLPPLPPEPLPSPSPSRPVKIYKVKTNDSLSTLADKFNTTQEAIMSLNPQIIEPKRWVMKDDTLIIPDGWS